MWSNRSRSKIAASDLCKKLIYKKVDDAHSQHINLLYILNLLTLSGTTKQKTPNMVGKQAKSDQTLTSVAGYKWSQKSAIFGKVLEKGLT